VIELAGTKQKPRFMFFPVLKSFSSLFFCCFFLRFVYSFSFPSTTLLLNQQQAKKIYTKQRIQKN
jgi:hypothetical protein